MSQSKSKWQDVHGLLLLNKPKDITSNSALQKVRRIFNAKKAGHTGSLDPMATGLLPCCFGDATKVAGLMLNADKVYVAECQIGAETDTADATGNITQTSNKTQLSKEEIHKATESLIGKIQQIPPMYSALHHKGKRLYELARAGIEVERKAREVTIHDFKVLEINNTNQNQIIRFKIKVSKGTYIRTLIEDFAKCCGTFAHMTSLHRTQLGILSGSMVNLDQLENTTNPYLYLKTMDTALVEYQKLQIDPQQVQTLIHGLRFKIDVKKGIYRLYDETNRFLGLGESINNSELKVKNLFLKSYFSKKS